MGCLLVGSTVGYFNFTLVFIINTVYLFVILQFAFNKMCIFSIWFNKALDRDKCTPYYTLCDVVFGKVKVHENNCKYIESQSCPKNSHMWLSTNSTTIVILILINLAYLMKSFGF
uniref:Uncharacterized protein n=1 Tax=viral metagenome TaxID=1070528 RepID=A0A6C0BGE8_9ZZZZ